MRSPFTTCLVAPALVASIALSALPGMATATSAPPQLLDIGFVEDSGAADRIEAGDRLRTLTQTLASAACHVNSGVDVKASKKILKGGLKTFDKILNALEHGDVSMHILGAEERPSTLRDIAKVRDHWGPMRDAYATLIDTPDDSAALDVVYAGTEDLLEETKVLLVHLTAEYTNPTELLQADQLMMDVAAGQAMASQRLSYEACRIWSGTATQKHKDELRELTGQFEFAVNALANGAPQLGLQAAPTPEIKAKLEKAISNWDDVSWKLLTLADAETLDHEEATKLCRVLYGKMAVMEKISHMYTEYSRRVY